MLWVTCLLWVLGFALSNVLVLSLLVWCWVCGLGSGVAYIFEVLLGLLCWIGWVGRWVCWLRFVFGFVGVLVLAFRGLSCDFGLRV